MLADSFPPCLRYSIADIANWGWVNGAYFAGVDFEKFPNVQRWWQKISDRPAVKKGLVVPMDLGMPFGNAAFKEKLGNDADFKAQHEELQATLNKAKEQYD